MDVTEGQLVSANPPDTKRTHDLFLADALDCVFVHPCFNPSSQYSATQIIDSDGHRSTKSSVHAWTWLPDVQVNR